MRVGQFRVGHQSGRHEIGRRQGPAPRPESPQVEARASVGARTFTQLGTAW